LGGQASGVRYLDLLEGVGHHSNEHVNEHDDGHGVIAEQHVFGDALSEILDLAFADRPELCQAEQRPEERHVTFPQTACISQPPTDRQTPINPHRFV